ncbi:MAG: hypothetical protein AAGK37_08980 [Pseudomonadota bacterium]
MDTVRTLPFDLDAPAAEDSAPGPLHRHLWPLMGDIASARAGVPELLIQWRRAEGADDLDPHV